MSFNFTVSTTPKTTGGPAIISTVSNAITTGAGLFGSTSTSTSGLQLGGAGDIKTATSAQTADVKPTGSTTPLSFSLGTTTTTALNTGSLTFGVTPITTSTPQTSASTFNFGSSIPSLTTTSSAPSFSLTPSTTTSSLKLGASVAPSLSQTTALSSTGISTLSTTTSTTIVAPVASKITFVQLEETINKWTHELEEQEKIFMSQAAQINNWDSLLNSNSDKIISLNNEVAAMKLQQQQLDHELDFILAQQRELEEVLAPLEKQITEVPTNTDPEREHTYLMAETLDTQLKQMSEDLREIIEHINESSRTQDTSDPVVQIGHILNAHMNSLHWIDQMTLNIQNQLENVTRLHDTHRRENERSFRISYE